MGNECKFRHKLIFIGIVGQYLARVFEESKARPMYVFKQEPGDLSSLLLPEHDESPLEVAATKHTPF